jgi:hypothetical protein
MKRLRLGVAGALMTIGMLCGCQSNRDTADKTGTAGVPPEKLAEVRARYSAIEGYLVGDVEEVDPQNHRAAVSGIDPKLVQDQATFFYVDASDGNVTNNGMKLGSSAVSGRIFVDYDPQRTMLKRGDLAVTKVGNK